MASEKLRSIRNHVFRYARALDVARWNYHFEDGGAKDVLKALAVYRNPDGGFGHGLEPDIQNPDSTPLGTWVAVRVLRELDFPALARNMIRDMHHYLLTTDAFDGTRWAPTIPTNNDWPHAPWWEHKGDATPNWNPTAELAGFLLRTADPGTKAYLQGERIIATFMGTVFDDDFEAHELVNIVALLDDLEHTGRTDLLKKDFAEEIARQVHGRIEQDPARYTSGEYVIGPKYYIADKDSPYYEKNKEICAFYADHLEETVGKDGAWAIHWDWGEYEMLHNAHRDWQGSLIVDNMLFLQGMKPDLTTVG